MTEFQRRILRKLEAAHALNVGNAVFAEKWVAYGVRGDPRDIAASISWSDERGYVWELDFTGQSLNEAQIDGNQIRMIDSEGDEVSITVFQLEPVYV